MSEQEIAAAMESAVETQPQTSETPPVAESNTTESAPVVSNTVAVSDCTQVYDYVIAHTNIINGWKKMKLVGDDGNEVTDTKNVLIGVSDDGTPVAFSCKNLVIPNTILDGVTSIKVLISGIIMVKADATIYVSKNNVYVFKKDANGNRNLLVTYSKIKNGAITFSEQNRDTSVVVDTEYVKLIAKTHGGRLFAIVEDLTDLSAMRESLLKFLNEKVSDINYCIKIENVLLQFGF